MNANESRSFHVGALERVAMPFHVAGAVPHSVSYDRGGPIIGLLYELGIFLLPRPGTGGPESPDGGRR